MSDDGLYPRTTEYYTIGPDDERDKLLEAEEAAVANEKGVINGVIERLESAISSLKSIDALPNDLQSKPDEMLHVIMGNKKAAAVLEVELINLRGLVDEIKE